MTSYAFHNAIVLTGPTGAGKSQLAIELAERLGAEIVSMDSMALYRGMDVGTAKPSPEERRRVPHHLIDVLDPWESASVAWWLEQAAACCRAIEARGKRPLVVGGTALYLKALLYGLFDGPPADPALRRRLEEEAGRLGRDTLHRRLATVDPAAAARVHPNDVRRVVRALEVWELTGRPISAWQTQWPQRTEDRGSRIEDCCGAVSGPCHRPGPPVSGEQQTRGQDPWPCQETRPQQGAILDTPSLVLWLDLPRDELYARIDARVRRMIDAGLADEVRALRRLGRPLSREASQALGYKEMFDYLDGRTSLEEAAQLIQLRSRRFAKRQLTWFRRLPPCRPVNRQLTFRLLGLTME